VRNLNAALTQKVRPHHCFYGIIFSMQIVGRNIFSLGLSRITSGVILFVVQTRLASYLGPHGFGKLSVVLAFYTIFLLFVDLGISRFAIKKISEDKEAVHTYYGNFLLAQFITAIFVFALFLIIPRVMNYDTEISRAMIYAGAGLLFTAISIPAVAIMQAWQKIHIYAAVIFVESLAKAAWFAYAIWARYSIVFIMEIYLYVGIFDVIVWYFLTRRIAVPRLTFNSAVLKSMFVFGIPFAMLSGFEMLIAKIDVIIQKMFLPYAEVGLYSAAYRFLDFLTFLPAIIAISLFPHFSGSDQLDSPENVAMSERLHRYLLAVGIPLGVGATLLAGPIIMTLFGSGYEGSIMPFRVLIWSTVITLFYAVPNVVMQVRSIRKAIVILGSVTFFNIAANWALVPRYGIMASAWLTVLSYILVGVLYIAYSRKFLRFSIFGSAFWPILASVIMGAALWIFREWNLFILGPLGIVIYFTILRLAGFLNREDIKSILARS